MRGEGTIFWDVRFWICDHESRLWWYFLLSGCFEIFLIKCSKGQILDLNINCGVLWVKSHILSDFYWRHFLRLSSARLFDMVVTFWEWNYLFFQGWVELFQDLDTTFWSRLFIFLGIFTFGQARFQKINLNIKIFTFATPFLR